MIEHNYKYNLVFTDSLNDLSVGIIVQFFKNTNNNGLNYVEIIQDKKVIYIERFNKKSNYSINNSIVFAVLGITWDDIFNLHSYTRCSTGTTYCLCNKAEYKYFYSSLE